MTLTLLPLDQAIETLPEFDAISQRMLTQWVKDKLQVQRVIEADFPGLAEDEEMVEAVHANWMMKKVG